MMDRKEMQAEIQAVRVEDRALRRRARRWAILSTIFSVPLSLICLMFLAVILTFFYQLVLYGLDRLAGASALESGWRWVGELAAWAPEPALESAEEFWAIGIVGLIVGFVAVGLFGWLVERGEAVAQRLNDDKQRHAEGIRKRAREYLQDIRVKGDADQAARLFRLVAQNGDCTAQVQLGILYAVGCGVRHYPEEAVRWYRKAAEQGYSEGVFRLGNSYAEGRGVRRDFAEAIRWYRQTNHPGALQNLGFMHARALGVGRNLDEAARYYSRSLVDCKEWGWPDDGIVDLDRWSIGPHEEVYREIGLAYLRYEGVPRAAEEAAVWLGLAAEEGDSEAELQLCSLVAHAAAWLKLAAEEGDAEAQVKLGHLLVQGRGVRQDPEKAVGWYRRAARLRLAAHNGDFKALDKAGSTLYDDAPFEPKEAVRWYRAAAEQGDADSASWFRSSDAVLALMRLRGMK